MATKLRSSKVPKLKQYVHPSHDDALLRLKRATGHLTSVIGMIEDHRPCVEILQQLTAVISALGSTRTLLFQDHLNSCVRPLLKEGDEKTLKELSVIIRRSMKV